MGRAAVIAWLCGGCGFHALPPIVTDGPFDQLDTASDATPDAAPRRLCDQTAALVCFSFDAPTIGATIANEGTAVVTADASGITRIDRGDGLGGAVQLDTTSQIRIPPNAETQGIVAAEAWVRIDSDPPAGGRVGIMDADATSAALSFFYYLGATHQIRFEIGQAVYLDRTVVLGTWIYLAQVCEANTLTAYVDGVVLGSQPGCSPGNATTYGLQLGQNNTQQAAGNEWLTGALDGIRLWTTPLTAETICKTAGRTDC